MRIRMKTIVPVVLVTALAALAPTSRAQALSENLSGASSASLEALVAVSAAAFGVLEAGAELSVASLRVVGEVATVVFVSASSSAEFSLQLSADAIVVTGLAVGATVAVVAVAAGYLLQSGARVLAFVPDAQAASMIHSRKLVP